MVTDGSRGWSRKCKELKQEKTKEETKTPNRPPQAPQGKKKKKKKDKKTRKCYEGHCESQLFHLMPQYRKDKLVPMK